MSDGSIITTAPNFIITESTENENVARPARTSKSTISSNDYDLGAESEEDNDRIAAFPLKPSIKKKGYKNVEKTINVKWNEIKLTELLVKLKHI
jgi:hypothetical protein